MRLEYRRVDWPFKTVFRIAYAARGCTESVLVEVSDGSLTGRGEAVGVPYHGETADSIMEQLATVQHGLANQGVPLDRYASELPPGGARNAIDCALWDLKAKRAGCRAWELAGIPKVVPLVTAFTLGIDSPSATGEAAEAAKQYCVLKVKLSGEEDLQRVTAVRRARPEADIIVDANNAWNQRQLVELTPRLAELNVKLIEQPLPPDQDDILADYDSPVPFCADESCQCTESLPSLVGKYQYINIKLDKTGGLTEALRLARAATRQNFRLMVGCMAGSSLSMAPAFVVGQLCTVIDLDGPLLSTSDVANGIRYDGSRMYPPEASLWG